MIHEGKLSPVGRAVLMIRATLREAGTTAAAARSSDVVRDAIANVFNIPKTDLIVTKPTAVAKEPGGWWCVEWAEPCGTARVVLNLGDVWGACPVLR